jgi:hypothetical protein
MNIYFLIFYELSTEVISIFILFIGLFSIFLILYFITIGLSYALWNDSLELSAIYPTVGLIELILVMIEVFFITPIFPQYL